mmetsp:Transcript_26094/g.53581  ORF Transcript_26094/g.53581 Transcript_26094/m.53581 type:complete len:287 (-) Transcript_26094:1144-2004(-)
MPRFVVFDAQTEGDRSHVVGSEVGVIRRFVQSIGESVNESRNEVRTDGNGDSPDVFVFERTDVVIRDPDVEGRRWMGHAEKERPSLPRKPHGRETVVDDIGLDHDVVVDHGDEGIGFVAETLAGVDVGQASTPKDLQIDLSQRAAPGLDPIFRGFVAFVAQFRLGEKGRGIESVGIGVGFHQNSRFVVARKEVSHRFPGHRRHGRQSLDGRMDGHDVFVDFREERRGFRQRIVGTRGLQSNATAIGIGSVRGVVDVREGLQKGQIGLRCQSPSQGELPAGGRFGTR